MPSYSILVLIYIFCTVLLLCSRLIWVLGQFLIILVISFLIDFLINFSMINFLTTTSYNCLWTLSQSVINYCLVLPVTIKHLKLLKLSKLLRVIIFPFLLAFCILILINSRLTLFFCDNERGQTKSICRFLAINYKAIFEKMKETQINTS